MHSGFRLQFRDKLAFIVGIELTDGPRDKVSKIKCKEKDEKIGRAKESSRDIGGKVYVKNTINKENKLSTSFKDTTRIVVNK